MYGSSSKLLYAPFLKITAAKESRFHRRERQKGDMIGTKTCRRRCFSHTHQRSLVQFVILSGCKTAFYG